MTTTPAILVGTDLASGAAAAIQIYLHAQKGPIKAAGLNVVNSIAARYVSYYLSGLSTGFDSYVSASTKNYMTVYVGRALIAMFLKEPHALLRAWDASVADILADALWAASGFKDPNIIPVPSK